MNWLSKVAEFARRIRFVVFRDKYTAELEEELRLHEQLRAEQLQHGGLSAAEARYVARRRFGHRTTIAERSRDTWGLGILEQALADCRFAARRLRQRPGFALSTIAVAALGIGATTAVFSALDAVLLRPLPFVRPSELYTLPSVRIPYEEDLSGGRESRASTVRIDDVGEMKDVFSAVGAYAAGGLNLADPNNPQRVQVGVVTPGFFSTFAARAQVGRTFDEAEGRPHGPHSVILSDAFWERHFGRADILGKSIDLSGTRYTIVGIMKQGFNFPNESDLWIPLTVPTTDETFAAFRGFLPSDVVARTAPGVSEAVASSRLLSLWERKAGPPDPAQPSGSSEVDALRRQGAAIPLQQTLIGNTKRTFIILLGATGLLLLIACANVANLLVSDATSRRREVALREVLGASRSRIVRQLVVESLLLACIGAAVGVALSPMLMRLLHALQPRGLVGVAIAELNVRVLVFAACLALVTGVVFGLWPAIGSTRGDASETIKSGGSLGATANGLGFTRRLLVGTELALTVVLLVGSGLMLRSLHRLLSQDMGMVSEHVATLELSFTRGTKPADRVARLHAIIERLESDPGIQRAAAVNDLPLRGGGGIALSVIVDGAPKSARDDFTAFSRYLLASGGYFQTLGIPLLRGRTFAAVTDSLAPRVAIVNLAMAKRWWPSGDALGKTLRIGSDTAAPYTVIGIVGDVREGRIDGTIQPQLYLPVERQGIENTAIVARGTLPPNVLLARLRDAVRAVDPAQAIYNLRMMDEVVSRSAAPRRTNTTLIALFGAVALLLSAFGVYAVVSYNVTRRTREFGIRAALGATSRDIAALVGREMIGLVGVSLVVGLIASWALARVLSTLLFEVDTHDLPTYMAVPLVLLLPAAVATLIPARRATRVSPTEVMRAE